MKEGIRVIRILLLRVPYSILSVDDYYVDYPFYSYFHGSGVRRGWVAVAICLEFLSEVKNFLNRNGIRSRVNAIES